ncbi:class I SAM-dependent methyltransferase [Scytonema hofmannii FACHB-248]|uniref:Class I SAM-dependent methyltransferase n=1 Tax=Scytonema hofmannii FACHB-248 TaxID=1842502 RepID=A0ABR8H2R0_9CYAN|nr:MULTISPECIES: methyltransferase domain-containing protein [Nostocales]MBD2609313.1 class I SAM-dependent methyltransferase [Scytonema hofmannii FACHB-248]
MQLRRILLLLLTTVSVASLGVAGCTKQQDFEAEVQAPAPVATPVQQRQPDVPYVPTPQPVVDAMLQMAQVKSSDMLYDLGSGDGRIPITAAQKFKTRGVGIDINPERVQEANANAQKAGVTNSVEFRQQDLFETDLRNATVVTLYLLPDINLKLRPKLLKELKPGTRIVSHAFDMGEWKPQRVQQVDGKTIYLWVVPKQVPANLR